MCEATKSQSWEKNEQEGELLQWIMKWERMSHMKGVDYKWKGSGKVKWNQLWKVVSDSDSIVIALNVSCSRVINDLFYPIEWSDYALHILVFSS